MTIATIETVPTGVPMELARGRGGGGPAPKRIVVAYGFWIFILSDIVMFSGLFAAYAVLAGNTAGGPTGRELFNLRNVFIETMCLLFSSYTCGLGALSAERRQPGRFLVFAALTFVLGAAFLAIEASEFAGMVEKGAGPGRSGFLSAFFTLVGTHGVHVTSGLIWLIYLVAQVIVKGLRAAVLRRLLCWSLFWHALGHRLGRGIHAGLFDGRFPVTDGRDRVFDDRTPGVEHQESTANFLSYTAGLALAILLTIVSFVVSQTHLLWPPGIPVGLLVLAFAQIGVHLVFFLHLGSGSDNTNNILALAFGVLIVFLVIAGSIWITANLYENMMP